MKFSVDTKGVYRKHNDDMSVVCVVELQSTNPTYQEMMEWFASNPFIVLQPTHEQVDVLQVSPRQIRLALNELGLREMVESAVSASSIDVQDAWNYASLIQRNDPMLINMMQINGISEDVVNQVFLVASTK